jgi:hypothetical protein
MLTTVEKVEKHHGRIASFRNISEAEQQAQSWLTDGRAEKVKVYWTEGRWWASETPRRGGAKIAGNNQS